MIKFMNLRKVVYFSPIGYIISIMLNLVAYIKRPIMVYGYYCGVTRKYLRNVRISSSAIITNKENLIIEDNVWINHYVRIDALGGVSIGKGCQIGYGASILSHSSHNAIRLNGSEYINLSIDERIGYIKKKTIIGEYTFIGGGAKILPGTTIGKGCIIGVGTVVTKSIPDYSIVAGVPARIIGSTIDIDKVFLKDKINFINYYNKDFFK